MTDRRIIIDALLNSNKEEDLLLMLFKSLELKDSDKNPINVIVEDENMSDIIKKLYPFIKVTNTFKEDTLFLTKDNPKSILSYKVSQYKNDGYFNIGFADGIYTNNANTTFSKFLNPNPYVICCTNNPVYFQKFLKIVKQINRVSSIDIFIPKTLFDMLYKVGFDEIQKFFKSIMIENIDGTVQSICFSETGNVLRIKLIPDISDWASFVYHSIDHLFIDTDFCTIQPVVDTIVNFKDKFVWTNQSETYKDFLNHLSEYTYSVIKKGKNDSLLCFQYDQPLPDVFTLIKPKLDKVIKLAMLYPSIKDIIEIIKNKNISIDTKLNRLNKIK